MITLDRLEQKIDALTAGMNSVLAGQQALSGQIKGLGDGLAEEIRVAGRLKQLLAKSRPKRSVAQKRKK